ncbi:MAG: hypothetical protein AAB651_00165 [Patescibacteria group bacterium]
MAYESKKKKMADIVVPGKKIQKPAEAPALKPETPTEKKLEAFEKEVEEFEKEEIKKFREEDEIIEKKRRRFRIKFKTAVLSVTILALLAGLVYAALEFLPRAEIKITTKKSNWDYVDSALVDKNAASIDASNKQLPGEIFSQRKNITLTFPATGKQQVERKAKGKIVVYNAYSSDSQTLVAGTRFSTPDGKIFRLDSKLTVPGAKISEGKIVPSSVEAAITADKAGAEYNIGPISRLSIPGFSGTPKYQGFYGAINEPLGGGFVGEISVPTDADIKQGREKTIETLKQNLDVFVLAQIPPELKFIEGSKQFNVVKENIGKEADASGVFPIFIEAEYSVMVFKEGDLLSMLNALAKNTLGADIELKNYQLEYGVGRADFAKGQMSFPINFKGVFWKPIDSEKLKQSVLNKKEAELKTAIFSLPGVEKATASLWPFWVKRVPDNVKRVKIEID